MASVRPPDDTAMLLARRADTAPGVDVDERGPSEFAATLEAVHARSGGAPQGRVGHHSAAPHAPEEHAAPTRRDDDDEPGTHAGAVAHDEARDAAAQTPAHAVGADATPEDAAAPGESIQPAAVAAPVTSASAGTSAVPSIAIASAVPPPASIVMPPDSVAAAVEQPGADGQRSDTRARPLAAGARHSEATATETTPTAATSPHAAASSGDVPGAPDATLAPADDTVATTPSAAAPSESDGAAAEEHDTPNAPHASAAPAPRDDASAARRIASGDASSPAPRSAPVPRSDDTAATATRSTDPGLRAATATRSTDPGLRAATAIDADSTPRGHDASSSVAPVPAHEPPRNARAGVANGGAAGPSDGGHGAGSSPDVASATTAGNAPDDGAPAFADAGRAGGRTHALPTAAAPRRSATPVDFEAAVRTNPDATAIANDAEPAPNADGAMASGDTTPGTDRPAASTVVERGTALRASTPAPWAERVVESVRLATVRGGGEMRLRLEPAGLGHIDVRINLAHDGVRAVITAEYDATRALLDREQHLLHAALERSELRLAGFSVDLGSGSSGGTFSGTEEGAHTLAAHELRTTVASDVPPVHEVIAAVEPGRLSVRV